MQLTNNVKAIIRAVIRRFGYYPVAEEKERNIGKTELLKNFFTCIKKVGFVPAHIVDVGANHGTWTREALKYFPNSYFTLLEPQAWFENDITDILSEKIRFFGVGAGSQAGNFKFTIANRDDSCTFRYSEQEAVAKDLKQIDVPVVTLDDLLADDSFPPPDIIKVDAEGLDLEVIKGAKSHWGKVEIFMVEASVMNKYFANNCKEILFLMDEAGYRLFDITDLNRTPTLNALWLVEFVFIKKNGIIDNAITSYN